MTYEHRPGIEFRVTVEVYTPDGTQFSPEQLRTLAIQAVDAGGHILDRQLRPIALKMMEAPTREPTARFGYGYTFWPMIEIPASLRRTK